MTPEQFLIDNWGKAPADSLSRILYKELEDLQVEHSLLIRSLRLLYALHRDDKLTDAERGVKLDVCELMGR